MLWILIVVWLLLCVGVLPVAQAQGPVEAPDVPPQKIEKFFGPISYQVPKQGINKLIPDISAIASTAGAYFSDDPVGFQGHDPNRTGFTLQEIELAIQSDVDPYFRADIFLAFLEDGVELEEGYAETTALLKGLKIRAGKLLIPLGRHNAKHLETWAFVDNMLMNKLLLGAEGLRELGLEVSYILPTLFFLQLQGTFTNGTNEDNFNGNRKQDLLYNARLSTSFDLTEATTVLLGTSGAWGFNDSARGSATNLYGGDLMVKWKPNHRRSVVWQSEFLYRKRQELGTNISDGGFYSYIDYQFLQRWHGGVRYDQVGLPSGLIVKQWRLTPALTFNPTEFSRLRLQYEFDQVVDADPVHAVMLQLQYSVGPHGAHPF